MTMPEKSFLLKDLKNYLTFLKDYGYSEIPLESGTILGSEADKTNLSHPSPEMLRQSTIETKITAKSNPRLKIEEVREELGAGEGRRRVAERVLAVADSKHA